MKARMSLWEELWAEPLANTPSHWCGLIPPPPLHRGKYKRGRPTETYSDTQTHTNTHPRVREGHSFEWVIQWETWQRWACWKTVLPLFAGPLQKRQWSGANRWTSCWSTNVRYFYPSVDVCNELVVFAEFLRLGLNPQGWRLHCCIVSGIHASSRLPALSHWMNALLNMLNGFHSDPRWVLDPYGVRERPQMNICPPYISWLFVLYQTDWNWKCLWRWDLGQEMSFPQQLFERLSASTCRYQQALMGTERWLCALGWGHTSFYFNTGCL